MRIVTFALIIAAAFAGCNRYSGNSSDKENLLELFSSGQYSDLQKLADSLRSAGASESILVLADSLSDMSARIKADFSINEKKFDSILAIRAGKYTAEEREMWENRGWIEWRVIDGRKMFFNRAASNLVLLKEFHLNRSSRDSAEASDSRIRFRKSHTEQVIAAALKSEGPVVKKDMEILYTLTVEPDAVPEGETVRCWLPYPKENNNRQSSVYLNYVSDENFIISPDSTVHKTVYMEKKAEKGKPVVFSIGFSYSSSGEYCNPEEIKTLPYDRNSEIFRKYTAEQRPQICFTPRVKMLADSIAGNEKNPLEITRKIYRWFSGNIPWAGALEYSIMPNIPEYVISNMKGDCGMQTFLLISMLRYKGIPARWQSGWMVPPGAENLHDWCEVYYEGTGWVPADVSYGLQYSSSQKTREFYITGIDSYRMIVNDGISGKLYPEKKFPRSEPYDFQRGEVEWSGGNIYFTEWDYEMEIRYKN